MSDIRHCEVCDMTFSSIYALRKHLKTNLHKRKQTPVTRKFSCPCGKQYSHRQTLYAHRKQCEVYKNPPTKEDQATSAVNARDKKIEELQRKLLEEKINSLEKDNQLAKKNLEIAELKLANSTQTTIYNTTHNHNTTIIINPFGFENLDYITDKDMLKCISMVYESVPSLFEKVHYNPEHPENNNIRIPNKKQPYIKIMDPNGKWKLVDKDYTMNALVYKYVDMLNDTFKEHKNTYPLKKRERIKELFDKVLEEDPETIKKISKNTELMILNNSK